MYTCQRGIELALSKKVLIHFGKEIIDSKPVLTSHFIKKETDPEI